MKRPNLFRILLFGAVYFTLFQAHAGPPPQTIEVEDIYDKMYAVVIGINEYSSDDFYDLRYSRQNAKLLANYLKASGFHVTALYDQAATRRKIFEVIEKQISPRLTKNDCVLFFFSGQGTTRQVGDETLSYIVPSDGDISSANNISMENLLQFSQQMGKAKHQLFIFDTCFAGFFGKGNVSAKGVQFQRNLPYIEAISKRRVRQFISAGGRNQVTLDISPDIPGAFIGELVTALKDGLADLNADGLITFSELATYLIPRATSERQTPAFGSFSGHAMGEFIFVAPQGVAAPIAKTKEIRQAHEEEFWEKSKNRTDPEVFALYLKEFPKGKYVEHARQRLVKYTVERSRSERTRIRSIAIDDVYLVKTDGFVREQPKSEARVVGTLKAGSTVSVLSKVRYENWYRVEMKSHEIGYVESNSLQVPEEGSRGKGSSSASTAVVDSRRPLSNYGRKFAVIAGISDYQYLPESSTEKGALIDLKYADQDARAFEEFLRDDKRSGGGWDIRAFYNDEATRPRVYDAIVDVATISNRRDLIFFFFSGHGRSHKRLVGDVYLLTHEFHPEDYSSGLDYAKVRDIIADAKAEHVIAFVDACRSGVVGFGKGGEGAQPSFDQDIFGQRRAQIPENKVIFSSGRSSQASWEDDDLGHGVFTYFLMQGIRGKAPENDYPEFVDLGELAEFVRENVIKYTEAHSDMAVQDPRLWENKGATYDKFPIALRIRK